MRRLPDRPGAGVLATLLLGALLGALLAAPVPASRALSVTFSSTARLQGMWTMSGQVTDALNVGGEHRGELVTRRWSFTPACLIGQCQRVVLQRHRGDVRIDDAILHRRAAGIYAGTGTFFAPAGCDGHRFARGTKVPFRIIVTVTAAALALDGQLLATRVRASYVNTARIGLTRCVSLPAHDAARYTGVPVVPPAGSTRTVARTASTTGS